MIKRAEGESRETAGIASGLSLDQISFLTAKYMNKGIEAIVEQHYTSHNRNMSYEEETALLEQFRSAAENGQVISNVGYSRETLSTAQKLNISSMSFSARSVLFYLSIFIILIFLF